MDAATATATATATASTGAASPAAQTNATASGSGSGHRNRQRRPPGDRTGTNAQNQRPPIDGDGQDHHPRRPQRQNKRPPPKASNKPESADPQGNKGSRSNTPDSRQAETERKGRRGAKFNPGLSDNTATPSTTGPSTNADAAGTSRTRGGRITKPKGSPPPAAPEADDLTSILTHALRTPPYPDCAICFNSIHPAQPTWSCSETGTENHCCWTTFHLKCIRSWAFKSVKEVADAWRARGEDRPGEWRCPGCQSKREAVPTVYWCFCHSTADPKPPRLATPHSCASGCSRVRASGCGHACPLQCHPGPCPPCQVTLQRSCGCGKRVLAYKCSKGPASAGDMGSSCGLVCDRMLGCGKHRCQRVCHEGECGKCEVMDEARCYCGKTVKEIGCGEGVFKDCTVDGEGSWVGRFECEQLCERLFDCQTHTCKKPCHPPSAKPPLCPLSPELTTHCPCGKHAISPSETSFYPESSVPHLSRTKCTDPIPTCTSTCLKPLSGCDHPCAVVCHTGPCPPCRRVLVRPCRCGSSTRDVVCSEQTDDEILCTNTCNAFRACGKHRCGRVCCPLASLAGAIGKGKGKKRAAQAQDHLGEIDDPQGLHNCDLVCGKLLSCKNHHCEERDHKGPCPPCLRSSFEEMFCNCGRTVLEPPIPCGTQIKCNYPCDRPPPPCGHPRTAHVCHGDDVPCAPCIALTDKLCACGKNTIRNVRCSLAREKVGCGEKCGKLLGCGFHKCERTCHAGECGTCTAVCGKPRKLCLPAQHPCQNPCHAPASCSEAEPCTATVTITCSCGRKIQFVRCGRSTANPTGRSTIAGSALECDRECAIAKRNRQLAEALNIQPKADTPPTVTYDPELVSFARANEKFALQVEKVFADFVTSSKKNQVLPHAPPEKRSFVQSLATTAYRMDTQLVDQDPHRSVQLIRRIDTRIPPNKLSDVLRSSSSSVATTQTVLGKLADMNLRTSMPPLKAPIPSSKPAIAGSRGWATVGAAKSNPLSESRTPTPESIPSASGGNKWASSRLRANRPLENASGTTESRTPLRSTTHTPVPAPSAEETPVTENWEDDV